MANKKLSELTAASNPMGQSDNIVGIQGGVDVKFTGAQINRVNASVTPFAGGGQASATQLNYGTTPITAPASAGDSLQLPPAVAGSKAEIFIIGASSTGMNVFAKNGTSDTLNGQSNSTAFACVASNSVSGQTYTTPFLFVCVTNGAWLTNASPD